MQATHDETLIDVNTPDNTNPCLSPILDEIQREDITYTYKSTWSTNYTMSNLEGAGRILGKLYSRTGLALERSLGSLAYRAGIGSYVKLIRYGLYHMFVSADIREHDKACKIMLKYARYVCNISVCF